MTTENDTIAARAAYVVGDAIDDWPPEAVQAWTGFIEVFAQMKHDVERELSRDHRLTTAMVGVLGRLAAAEGRTLRLSLLARSMDRSLGRVSRIVDLLEERGLVERRPDPTDARATNAHLTPTGLTLVAKAQTTAASAVQRIFFEPLGPEDVRALGGVFDRLLQVRAGAGSVAA